MRAEGEQRPAELVRVRVQPGAAREGLKVDGDALRVQVTARALEGRANRAVCRLVAAALEVAPGRVVLVRGERSRDKWLRVEGMSARVAVDRLRGKAYNSKGQADEGASSGGGSSERRRSVRAARNPSAKIPPEGGGEGQ